MSAARLFTLETRPYHAMCYARAKHHNQRRKYTNNPYFDHLVEVAGIVASVTTCPTMLSVAYLHDCIEDQGVKHSDLLDLFGEEVADGVQWLSDMESGNRAERKRLSRERLARAPGWVQTIKCADLISNTSSIVDHDRVFAKVYLAEKRLTLEVLTAADPRLLDLAWVILEAGEAEING